MTSDLIAAAPSSGPPPGHGPDRPAALFGSKAETLEQLTPLIRTARILPLHHFPVGRWHADRDRVLDDVAALDWGHRPLIVRSSTRQEDDPATMMPGGYRSVGGVEGRAALRDAVEDVIASYRERPGDPAAWSLDEQLVLVQPYVCDATMTGVVFTCDPNTGAPYLVVNYEQGGDPSAVTNGHRARLHTYYAWRGAIRPGVDPRLRRLTALAAELEDLFGQANLDIEFAYDRADELYLLQVRPLVVPADGDNEAHQRGLDAVAEKVRTAGQPHPRLLGERTVFGVMPDWNPAEIVGTRPRPLALSLYRRLITDAQWADQRARYGYRDVRGFPLMLDFFGLPYVDVRESCNSLIPASVDDHLAARLVDHCVDRLTRRPELHDKVEFEVVFSCYSFTLRQRLADQTGDLFSARERDDLVAALRTLTNDLMDPDHPARREDLANITSLGAKLDQVRRSELDLPAQIYWLLEDCRRFGTLAFAGFARLGFVATEILRSLVAVGVLTEADVARLMASLDTVTNRMLHDRALLSREDFLDRYGFLRPGTYDIRCPRYDEDPDGYFDWPGRRPPGDPRQPFELPADTMRAIDDLLRQHRLDQDAYGLLAFIVTSIEHRENAKFEFSRHLSEALSLLRQLGGGVGLSPDDMSYVGVDCVDTLYRSASSPAEVLARCAADGRQQYGLTRRLVLPPIITGPADVTAFHVPGTEPNYVTQCRATGPVAQVSTHPTDLRGRILMLPSGDPGYDWIFSEGVAGFVTRYGGANSHMAIRAHQFGVPAVIGVGETLYDRWSSANRLTIDCLNRRVELLR
ncbi:PEP/pyruvate-binding domain-containing protein [Micromonospora cathayae]|uniref:PEP-utilizing enzyme n=1 Tax=Micromonospora cathayae TaxID=3028804 RepID=A0ABY7ZP67_9ACTN|nr:PEP/pyruvate-binding domain-containing protein [Micromonospora sp. HUAS 3]WDZ84801.1 PEP-utilizing enzyme [Micromonospora sp. HUAS 3]